MSIRCLLVTNLPIVLLTVRLLINYYCTLNRLSTQKEAYGKCVGKFSKHAFIQTFITDAVVSCKCY